VHFRSIIQATWSLFALEHSVLTAILAGGQCPFREPQWVQHQLSPNLARLTLPQILSDTDCSGEKSGPARVKDSRKLHDTSDGSRLDDRLRFLGRIRKCIGGSPRDRRVCDMGIFLPTRRWEAMLNNTVSVSESMYYGKDRAGHLACSSRLPCISCSPPSWLNPHGKSRDSRVLDVFFR